MMNKLKTNVAIYVDMENIHCSEFDLNKLMNYLTLEHQGRKISIVVKSAYGDQNKIDGNLKKQFVNFNFNFIDTPSINKKNRADLMLSIDALESILSPIIKIDKYCFMTSDSDFTVVSERLRKYGAETLLICHESDKSREILKNSFDNLISIEDYRRNDKNDLDVTKEDNIDISRLANENTSLLQSSNVSENKKKKNISQRQVAHNQKEPINRKKYVPCDEVNDICSHLLNRKKNQLPNNRKTLANYITKSINLTYDVPLKHIDTLVKYHGLKEDENGKLAYKNLRITPVN